MLGEGGLAHSEQSAWAGLRPSLSASSCSKGLRLFTGTVTSIQVLIVTITANTLFPQTIFHRGGTKLNDTKDIFLGKVCFEICIQVVPHGNKSSDTPL